MVWERGLVWDSEPCLSRLFHATGDQRFSCLCCTDPWNRMIQVPSKSAWVRMSARRHDQGCLQGMKKRARMKFGYFKVDQSWYNLRAWRNSWGHWEWENSGSTSLGDQEYGFFHTEKRGGLNYHTFHVLEYSCGLFFFPLIFNYFITFPLGISFTSRKTMLWYHLPVYKMLQDPLRRAVSAPFPQVMVKPSLPQPCDLVLRIHSSLQELN